MRGTYVPWLFAGGQLRSEYCKWVYISIWEELTCPDYLQEDSWEVNIVSGVALLADLWCIHLDLPVDMSTCHLCCVWERVGECLCVWIFQVAWHCWRIFDVLVWWTLESSIYVVCVCVCECLCVCVFVCVCVREYCRGRGIAGEYCRWCGIFVVLIWIHWWKWVPAIHMYRHVHVDIHIYIYI